MNRKCRPLLLKSTTCLVAFMVFSALPALSGAADGIKPRNAQAIADVAAGRVATARASWWGFHPDDATKALQAALRSRAKKVVVERMGRPWIVTPIQLPSDKEILFEPGVVVEAKRGEFLGKGDCLFVARGCKRLVLRGKGAIFRMHKSDYHKPPYALAEWRHALSLRGCDGVTVEGLTLRDSGGDGIYLGVGSGGAPNRNIAIRNVDCDGNNRQGISVITAENLLIEGCVFRNTRGTAPQAGIDFEPNHPEEKLVNCLLRNCRSEGNAGHAYHIYLGHMHAGSPPVSIRFENCTSRGNGRYSTYVGVANRNGEQTVRGSIAYVGCRFDADRGAGVYIRGNEADGCKVRFDKCEIIRRDDPEARLAPITIAAPQRLDLDAGNVAITECLIKDSLDRRPIDFAGSPLTGLRNVSGSLTVQAPAGRASYVLDAAQVRKWFPMQGVIARIPRLSFDWRKARPFPGAAHGVNDSLSRFRLRRRATLVVWGRKGNPVRLSAVVEPVGRHDPTFRPIALAYPDGREVKLSPKVESDHAVYAFTPEASGPVRLLWQGDNRETIRMLDCGAPAAILGGPLGVNLIRPVGRLDFVVPSGVKRFAVVIAGAGTAETVKAAIRNASGEMVSEQDNIAAPHAFVLERDDCTKTDTWSITFGKASQGVLEDVSVHLVGVPPLLMAGSRR